MSQFKKVPNCKTCHSQYFEDIHRMILVEKATLREAEAWLKEKGEIISDTALGNHFNEHVYPYLEEYKRDQKVTAETVEKLVKEDFNVMEDIKDKLSFLRDTLEKITEDPQQYLKRATMLREVRGLVNDIIKFNEQYERLKREYFPSEIKPPEEIYRDFIEAAKDIPPEHLQKIIENLSKKGYK